MVPLNVNLHLAGVLAAAATALAGFNPESGQNVAVYWGQNAAANSPESHDSHQERLAYYCDEASIDIINIAFITGITPVTVDFANADRSKIEEDIKSCQEKGKTILVSMGGGSPASTNWNSTSGAEKSAQLIWNMFGPMPSDKIERPFGSAAVDGFDFDFESTVNYLPAFAGKLRQLMDAATEKKFLLSAAPQCVNPDVNLGPTLDAVPFDMVQIQFYNNPCGVDKFQQSVLSQPDFNFAIWDEWAQTSKNPKVKVLMGIPASMAAGAGYTGGPKLKAALDWTKLYRSFGGVMMWDMAQLYANKNFLQEVVNDLDSDSQPPPSQSPSSTSTGTATALSSPLNLGRWQPLRDQRVMDLAVVYGKEVAKLFNSPPWNPDVLDVDVIWSESTYTVQYTPLPTAALSALISWSSTSTGSLTTTMFLKFPTSVSRYETSPRAGTSPSRSTATETITTKSASAPASVPTSDSEASLPSSLMSSSTSSSAMSSVSITTSSSTPSSASRLPSSTSPTSVSTSPSHSTPSFTSSPASALTSTSSSAHSAAPSPMTTGLIQEICSSCYITAGTEHKFSCQCGRNLVNGDLNNYVWNDQGILKAGHGGRFADSCASPEILNPPISNFRLLAACKGAPPTGADKQLPLQHLDLGSIIQVIYEGEYKFKLKDT